MKHSQTCTFAYGIQRNTLKPIARLIDGCFPKYTIYKLCNHLSKCTTIKFFFLYKNVN